MGAESPPPTPHEEANPYLPLGLASLRTTGQYISSLYKLPHLGSFPTVAQMD